MTLVMWGRRDDRGFVTGWTIVLATACIGLVGLAFDSGRYLRARSEAYGAAAAAARAGVQQLDERAAVQGDVRLDEDAAHQAAVDYITARGFAADSVVVDPVDLEVTVSVTDDVDMVVLVEPGSIGFQVEATAQAIQGTPGGGT